MFELTNFMNVCADQVTRTLQLMAGTQNWKWKHSLSGSRWRWSQLVLLEYSAIHLKIPITSLSRSQPALMISHSSIGS